MDHDEQCVLHGDRLLRVEILLEQMTKNYLDPIKEQVTKTNGRVNALEQRASRHGAWIGFLWIAVGAVAVSLFSLLVAHIFGK